MRPLLALLLAPALLAATPAGELNTRAQTALQALQTPGAPLPAGIRLVSVTRRDGRAVVRLSAEARALATQDAAHDELLRSLMVALHDAGVRHLRLEVPDAEGRFVELDRLARIPDARRPPTAFPFKGALTGHTVVLC